MILFCSSSQTSLLTCKNVETMIYKDSLLGKVCLGNFGLRLNCFDGPPKHTIFHQISYVINLALHCEIVMSDLYYRANAIWNMDCQMHTNPLETYPKSTTTLIVLFVYLLVSSHASRFCLKQIHWLFCYMETIQDKKPYVMHFIIVRMCNKAR